jgi:RecA/RadA recombinase
MLMEMLHGLESLDDGNAAIVDSVSAIMPVMEHEGELSEAFIGQRAKLVSKMARKAMYILKNKTSPAILFVINHKYAIIPGMGSTTAGGNVLKNAAVLRANIWIDESITDSDKNLLASVVTGVTEKLRYGGAKRRFKFVIVPGVGVSRNLTAVIDCVDLGLATRGATMKIGETSMGRISALIEQESNDKKFEPFYNELVKYADGKGLGYTLNDFGIKDA